MNETVLSYKNFVNKISHNKIKILWCNLFENKRFAICNLYFSTLSQSSHLKKEQDLKQFLWVS